MVDIPLLTAKMAQLEHCLSRVCEKLPAQHTVFAKDWDVQDIVFRNLQNATQICIDIAAHVISDQKWPLPQKMSELFLALENQGVIPSELSLEMRRLVGFRNILVHEYANVDLEKAYQVAQNCLKTLPVFCKALHDFSLKK